MGIAMFDICITKPGTHQLSCTTLYYSNPHRRRHFQVLPGLQAFCTTCAIAIGAIFVLQSSWFVAWMTLDELRIAGKRDGLVPCIVHRNWIPPKWSTKNTGKKLMSFVANFYKRTPVQMLVLLATAGLLAVGGWGAMQIREGFISGEISLCRLSVSYVWICRCYFRLCFQIFLFRSIPLDIPTI